MTPDERLEELAARHDALSQTVELMAVAQRSVEERLARTEGRLAQLMEAVNRLVNIADAHEQRLDEPDDGPP